MLALVKNCAGKAGQVVLVIVAGLSALVICAAAFAVTAICAAPLRLLQAR